ncbi:MAG: hypothetical protein V8S26_03855 [Lachnospiraceae bacterium]
MKRIAIRIQNSLQAEGVLSALKKNGGFIPYKLSTSKASDTIVDCKALEPDILLMAVSYLPEETIENCLAISSAVRAEYPKCKIVFLCDENSFPELAEKIVSAKQDEKIDAFFYSSTDGKYLAAVLSSL